MSEPTRRPLFFALLCFAAAACGGSGTPPKATDQPPMDAPASSATAGDSAPAASSAPAEPPVPTTPTIEECADLGKWPKSAAVPTGNTEPDAPKTVVPWMVDPFGNRTPPSKKKQMPPDSPELVALRSDFRQCNDTARKADPSQQVIFSFEHKPKGGKHTTCVRILREEGRDDVTKDLAKCMMNAIKVWSAKAP